ncbi:MAG TPA: SpoIIE family protein phosphatase [Solirubrobacterales bacterium]|nr:SpoIIE family protein phosphatase [Solirubrobacterales bacterium]
MGEQRKPPWTPAAARIHSPLWSGLAPALIALAGLAILDSRADLAITGFFALVPFTTALSGNARATAVVAALTVAVVAVSGTWNHNYDSGDYWVRAGLVAIGSAFACYVATAIGRNNRATTRNELLNRVAAAGEERPTLEATLERITDLVVPDLADICMIDSIAGERLERIAVRAAEPRRAEVEPWLLGRRPSVSPEVAFGDSTEPVVNRFVGDDDLVALGQSADDLTFLRTLGVRSYVAFALRSRGRRIGALTLVRAWSGRRFDEDDVAFGRMLADRFALTLDNAGLFSDLESVEMRMDAVMEVLDEPVTITERGGRLIFANQAAVDLAGHESLQELLEPDGDASGFDIYDEDGEILARDALPWDLPDADVIRLVDPARGDETWLRARSRAMAALDNRPMYTVTAFEDVSEMKFADFAQSVFASTAELLSASTDPQLMLQRLAELLTPRLGDACGVLMPDGEGMLSMVAVADVDATRETALRELLLGHPLSPVGMEMEEVLRSPVPIVYDTTRPDAWPGAAQDIATAMGAFGYGSVMVKPLRIADRLIGIIGFASRAERRAFTPLEQRVALRISERVALAVDNARIASQRSEIAATLQSGLRPAALPEVSGWSLAALYNPAGAENQAGGDFYDLVPVDGGWMAMIGDVTGHGARAASLTALARYTLRTAAALTDPVRALGVLNDALLARADGALCSVVLLTLDLPTEGEVRIAVAGHPSPFLVHDGATSAIRPAGPVLGAFDDASWEVESLSLAHGDQLLVYTDGVLEARGREGRFGEERLCRCLEDVGGPDDAIERISTELDRFAVGELADDAAALAVMRTGGDGRGAGGSSEASERIRPGAGVSPS